MTNFKRSASLAAIALALAVGACSRDSGEEGLPDDPAIAEPRDAANAATPPSREGLAPGLWDAGEAVWNLTLIHSERTPEGFVQTDALWSPAVEGALFEAQQAGEETERPPSPISFANSDMAISGNRVVMGNWHGFNVFESREDGTLEHVLSVVCPGGQGDVSIHGDLVFRSVEDNRARLDCGTEAVEDEVSADRFRGVQIFDIADMANPRQVAAVQTCRGSHTHTLVPGGEDADTLYIYNSGTAGVRPTDELDICSDGEPEENPDTALYSIDVIAVPLANPAEAAIVNRPRIFADAETGEIAGLWRGGAIEEDGQESSVTNQCHDITVYPDMGLAAGACSGNGIILDISDPVNPTRIAEMSDSNMAYWHAALFNNDATSVVFTDEWGGGLGARCRSQDPDEWGANIIATLGEDGLEAQSYFKIPNTQSEQENCVAHNGALIPVPGRDIMVQGWYSGGLTVFDFTDPANPVEIAFFDRGPLDGEELYLGGHWAAYWHNGRIYAPEIVRGIDVLALQPSVHLSRNEIAAAELIRFEETNPQVQVRFEWPDHPVVAHAYLDQLERGDAIGAGLLERARAAVDAEAGDPALAVELREAAVAADNEPDARRYRRVADWLGRTG
ncbi:LVIVD repeat-containing protein [Maricaulis sp. CAU 1757]